MRHVTDRELTLSRLLDDVLCLYAFAKDRTFEELTNSATQKAYQEIAKTRKLATKDNVRYPITLLLWDHLRKKGLL